MGLIAFMVVTCIIVVTIPWWQDRRERLAREERHSLQAYEAPEYEPMTVDNSFAEAVEAAYAAQGFRFDPQSFTAERASVPPEISALLPKTQTIHGGGFAVAMCIMDNLNAIIERSLVRNMMEMDGVKLIAALESKEHKP